MTRITESQLRKIIREEIINEMIPRKVASVQRAKGDVDVQTMPSRKTSSKPAKHPRPMPATHKYSRPIPIKHWNEDAYEEPKRGQKWSRGDAYRPDYNQYMVDDEGRHRYDTATDLLMITAVDMKTVSIVTWVDDYIPNSGGRKQQTNIEKMKIPRLQWKEWLKAGNWSIQHDSGYYDNYAVPKF